MWLAMPQLQSISLLHILKSCYQHIFPIMKFTKILGFVLLVNTAANSVPVEEVQKDDIEEMILNNEAEDNNTSKLCLIIISYL